MSNFLAIDTSSRYLTVLAVKGEKRIMRFMPDCAMKHSVILMDEIDKALKEAELTPAECDFFAAVTGPGSFTGIRIGISTAKGFALAAEKPLLGVTTFDLLAYNVQDDNFFVCVDAAHSHYYVCGYGKDKNITMPPVYMDEESVRKLEGDFYGFEDLPLPRYSKLEVQNCLHPAICLSLGRLTGDIHALYVRKSQAEENRK